MAYVALRKKRKHPAITKSSEIFSQCIDKGDYKGAAIVVYWCTLQVGGVNGIMSAMHDASSFWIRKEKRRGL